MIDLTTFLWGMFVGAVLTNLRYYLLMRKYKRRIDQ